MKIKKRELLFNLARHAQLPITFDARRFYKVELQEGHMYSCGPNTPSLSG